MTTDSSDGQAIAFNVMGVPLFYFLLHETEATIMHQALSAYTCTDPEHKEVAAHLLKRLNQLLSDVEDGK